MKVYVVLVLIYTYYIKISLCALLPWSTKIAATDNQTTDNNATTLTFSSTCIAARKIFINEGLQDNDIFSKKQAGVSLSVCDANTTCCSSQAESALKKLSATQLSAVTKPLHVNLKQKYGNTGATFKHLFRTILDKSYNNLDTMFKRTYESRYQNNSYVFKTLYRSLHQYFNGSELDLQSSVDTFFEKLFEKIYVMSQPWSVFDKKYENCIFESTNYVKPFGDIQRKVGHQIIRSFLASRVFLVGLKEGMEVATKLLQLPMLDECSKAFMKMTQCSVCSGVSRNTKPCRKYCVNVIKGCYVDTIIVQPMWNQFIDAMVSLTSKIEGPFSMEAVIEPLGVKISEAIMAFQENQANITNKVKERCGEPTIQTNLGDNARRKRRSTLGTQSDVTDIKSESKRLADEFKSDTQKVINGLRADSASTLPFLYNFNVNNQKTPSKFEKMLRETKASLAELKDYWVKLSERWCSENAASIDTDCWNGRNTSGYHLDVVNDLVKDYINNPEVKYDLKQNNHLILDQVSILERNLKLVKSALNGNTEQCVDVDCEGGSGEGSGDTDDGSTEGGSGDPPSDPTTEGSGDPIRPTESSCANSVSEDCVETIGPKTIDNNNSIPFMPVNEYEVIAASTYNKSYVNCGSILLLLLCLWMAVVL